MTPSADPPSAASATRAPIYVLVVAYGESESLGLCLERLAGAYPVVIVDNSSSAATRALGTRHGVTYVDAGDNLGFAAAVNRGLTHIPIPDADVLLLNPDAVIDAAAVEALAGCLDTSPDIACAAPAQTHPISGKPALVCWPFPTPSGAWVEALGLGRFRRGWGYVIASVLLLRGAALQDVGGFDEGFFLYAEEADWERRATGRGWRISYCPGATATHVGAGTDPDPRRRQLRFHAGVERYVRKWHGGRGWRSYQAATVATALRRTLVRRGDPARTSLALARLYTQGPYRMALEQGVVPARLYGAPAMAGGPAGQPRRVLLIDSMGYEELGGASIVLDETIRNVDRSRFVPVLACLSTGKWPEMVRSEGTTAFSFPRTRLRSLGNVFQVVRGLRGVIRDERIDLIHASENTALPYAAVVGRLTRTPVIWHIHSPLVARSGQERVTARVLRWLSPAHIVFTSPGASERTMEFPGTPSSVIVPGIDLERCRSGDGGRGRGELGIPEDAVVVSVFARVDPMKGQSDFVKCVGRLAARHPRLYGLMCGPGDRQGSYWLGLDELSREFGLGGRLLMPGDVRPPLKDDLVAASDVVVHPSHAESFGLAVLEAMAAAKPVVAAATDGPRLLIENGVNGVIVPVGDVDALADAVGRLLDDEGARSRLGERASHTADGYPVAAMVRRIEDLWAAVLVTGGGRRKRSRGGP